MVRQRLLVGTRHEEQEEEGGAPPIGCWLLVLGALLPSLYALPSQQGPYPSIPPDLEVLEVCFSWLSGCWGRIPQVSWLCFRPPLPCSLHRKRFQELSLCML